MMELNAEQVRYKMSEKQIKTALVCLSKPNSTPADREKCYFMWKEPSCFSCYHEVAQNALALITSQEQKIFDLENRLKECENGYEGTLYLDRCKLHDAEEKIKELTEAQDSYELTILECESEIKRLTEENERLRQNNLVFAQGVEKVAANYYNLGCTDTVRKMQERLKAKAYGINTVYGIRPEVIDATDIDQIAKEMLEDNNERT